MKHAKEKDLFKKLILNIPGVEKCEQINETDKEAIFEIEGRRRPAFHVVAHFINVGYPKEIQNVLNQLSYDGYHMVVAPYISDVSDKLCKENGIGYIDAVGNCLFQHEYIYLNIIGNPNNKIPKRALKSIFERSSTVSSRILRIMLNDVNKTWYLKELGESVGCSIGQVSKVKEFLLRNSWVNQTNNGITLIDVKKIMAEWATVYNSKSNEVIDCYSLENNVDLEKKIQKMKEECGIDYYLTGFAGGVRYKPVVRYTKIHCYIKSEDIDEAIEYLGLKEVSSGANISLINPYDDCVLEHARMIHDAWVVSPVQAYLDCMGLKGRGEEIAEAILEEDIDR